MPNTSWLGNAYQGGFVPGWGGPTIVHNCYLPGAEIDLGLDCEEHPLAQFHTCSPPHSNAAR